MRDRRPTAVLITGAYGAGKTTAAEEIAAVLERAGVRFAAIDLDWLAWANLDDHGTEAARILLENLAAVVGNYRRAGITHVVLAGTVETQAEVDGLQAAIGSELAVVRLTAPIDIVEARLRTHPTSGRQDDLEHARHAIAAGVGASLGHLVVDGDRPIGEVAGDILDWLGWTPGEDGAAATMGG